MMSALMALTYSSGRANIRNGSVRESIGLAKKFIRGFLYHLMNGRKGKRVMERPSPGGWTMKPSVCG